MVMITATTPLVNAISRSELILGRTGILLTFHPCHERVAAGIG